MELRFKNSELRGEGRYGVQPQNGSASLPYQVERLDVNWLWVMMGLREPRGKWEPQFRA
jgi:hypothetical protein